MCLPLERSSPNDILRMFSWLVIIGLVVRIGSVMDMSQRTAALFPEHVVSPLLLAAMFAAMVLVFVAAVGLLARFMRDLDSAEGSSSQEAGIVFRQWRTWQCILSVMLAIFTVRVVLSLLHAPSLSEVVVSVLTLPVTLANFIVNMGGGLEHLGIALFVLLNQLAFQSGYGSSLNSLFSALSNLLLFLLPIVSIAGLVLYWPFILHSIHELSIKKSLAGRAALVRGGIVLLLLGIGLVGVLGWF